MSKYQRESICKAYGCDRIATRKGLCSKHYHRVYINGTLDKIKVGRHKNQPPKPCTTEGCNGIHYAKGLCINHYMLEHRNKIVV